MTCQIPDFFLRKTRMIALFLIHFEMVALQQATQSCSSSRTPWNVWRQMITPRSELLCSNTVLVSNPSCSETESYLYTLELVIRISVLFGFLVSVNSSTFLACTTWNSLGIHIMRNPAISVSCDWLNVPNTALHFIQVLAFAKIFLPFTSWIIFH